MVNRPLSQTGLFWSVPGNILCVDHAAEVVGGSWHKDGWAAVPTSSQGFNGVRYQCERCAPDRRAIARPTRVN